LLLSKLRFAIFSNWILDDAVLVLRKYYNLFFFNKLFLSINNVDIFDRFVNQPFLSSSSFDAVEVCEIREGSNVESCKVI
jgi:hypothetical protein